MKTTVIEFWAPRCPTCRAFSPTFNEWVKKYGAQAEFIKVNVDEVPRIPTVFVVRGGKVVVRFDRVPDEEEIAHLLQRPVPGSAAHQGRESCPNDSCD